MKVAFALEMEWGLKHHSEIYAGCQKFANEAKWATSIIPNSPKVLETGSYDGIIARVGTSFHKMAQYKKIPLVNVWQNSPVKDVASVFSNHYETGAIAAEHLLGRGLRRFGFLGHNRDKADIQQLDGYTETLKSEGYQSTIFKFNRSVIEGNAEGWEEFILQLRKWIKGLQPPVGIHATSDINCRYLIEICKSLELKIPHDLAIVGSGNEPLICSSPYPSLTSIDKNFEELLNVIVNTKKCTLPENYLEKVGKAQTIFENNIDIQIDESFFTENKEVFDNQQQVVKEYLKKYTAFSDQKIKNRILS